MSTKSPYNEQKDIDNINYMDYNVHIKDKKKIERISDKKRMPQKVLFGKFFSCPQCGKALAGEMESYFTCPNCKKALCMERQLKNFTPFSELCTQ